VTRTTCGYRVVMVRRIREEYIEDEPIVTRRRIVTERHVGGPAGFGLNPVAMVTALLLVVVLLFLFFGIR